MTARTSNNNNVMNPHIEDIQMPQDRKIKEKKPVFMSRTINKAYAIKKVIERLLLNDNIGSPVYNDKTILPSDYVPVNSYTIGGIKYLLTYNHCIEITTIINNLGYLAYDDILEFNFDFEPIKKLIDKQINLNSTLSDAILKSLINNKFVNLHRLEDYVELLGKELVVRIINKVLTQYMLTDIMNGKYVAQGKNGNFSAIYDINTGEFICAYTKLAGALGENIFKAIKVQLKNELFQSKFDVKKFRQMIELNPAQLLDYYNKNVLSRPVIENDTAVKLLTIQLSELKTAEIDALMSIENLQYKNRIEDRKKKLIRAHIDIGSTIIELLTFNDILEQKLNRTNFVHLKQVFRISLINSASTFEPLLCSSDEKPKDYTVSKLHFGIGASHDIKSKYQIAFESDNRSTHTGHDYSIQFNNYKDKDKYITLEKLLEYSQVKYCVHNQFLNPFLDYIDNITKIENIPENLDAVESFIQTLYGIDMHTLNKSIWVEQAYLKNDGKSFGDVALFYYELLSEAIKFTDIFNNNLKTKYLKELKILLVNKKQENVNRVIPKFTDYLNKKDYNKVESNIKINKYKTYLRYIQKISHYKYFIIGLLSEMIIYSEFDHFYLPKYIAYTGRLNTKTFFTNLQAFKQVKTFIGIRKANIITKKNYEKYKNIIANNITDIDIKSKIEKTTFKEFYQIKNDMMKEYLLNYMREDKFDEYYTKIVKQTLDINRLTIELNTTKILKDPKTTWLFISQFYCLYAGGSTSDVILQLDASTNGLQIISMLTKNKQLGIKSNLIGNDKSDVYAEFLDVIAKFISELREFQQKIYNLYRDNFQYLPPPPPPPSPAIGEVRMWREIVDSFTLGQMERLFPTKITDINFISELPQITDSMLSFIEAFNLKSKKELLHDPISISLKIYKGIIIINALLNNNEIFNNVLKERDLVKKLVMAAPYGLTFKGIIKHLTKFIKEYAVDHGVYDIDGDDVYYLALFIENIFTSQYRKTNLIIIEKILGLRQYFDMKEPYKFTSKYITWHYSPYKLKSFKYEPRGKYKSRKQLNIVCPSNKLDKNSFRQTLIPILIHSADALIVHELVVWFYNVNKELKAMDLTITLSPNHDCYGICVSNIPFAKYIIQQQYINFNKTKYMLQIIQRLKLPKDVEQKVIDSLITNEKDSNYFGDKINNPWFVKF